MKIIIYIFIILLIASSLFAAESVKIVDGDGVELGTTANPIIIQGV